MKPSTASKHFCCTICQRGFTRIDHLKRHHLRHSGIKPYSCVFCDESFARCDNLRDHYTDCAKRGDRQIPETGQRGRRRHACQSCTSMKLRCDGSSPCSSCQKRGLECNNERKNQTKDRESVTSAGSTNDEDLMPPSDRGSIKFLLNGGTDSFTEQFLLPPRSDRTRGLEYHNQLGDAEQSGLPYHMKPESGYGDSDPSSLSFFQDTFIDFFNGPFGDQHKPPSDLFANGMAYPTIIPPDDPSYGFPGDPAYEPERPFATGMIQAILTRSWSVPLDHKAHEEISTALSFLLTTARIRRFVNLYFKYWQPSCAMLHEPTFDPDTVSLPLLTSVTFLGAMYSRDERETYAAKRLLDFAELFVFSSEMYAPENEIGIAYSGGRRPSYDAGDWTQFQNIQAGFIMCVVQYWSGGAMSRNRVMEHRFSEVVRVVRRIGLPKCRHQLDERIDELLWIQQECRIRTMNIICLLDCAFSFYQNFPCRLAHIEMECDFPSTEPIFASAHPFAEPNFQLVQEQTISETFQALFEEYDTQETQSSTPIPEILTRVTVFDMFILVHLLYDFINTHMTLQVPLLRITEAAQSKQPHTKARPTGAPEDATLASIRTALSRWRDQWLTLRQTVSSNEWIAMGFYKNGYNFWLVAHLLITRKESVDVVMRMEVNCEDKLQKLCVLLQDEAD
ncbi:hypothetical protein FE257_009474 [Aspergillus nanangensis]|uniref:C2H2 finger domain protein n=1 Tax=Aspergillus nanangensis TaxID=2582783 RepID=A0AAD4GSS2_ASPNN|nr:hypothetical protein FE257_009474 [Aspergillus nanangensis]